MTARLSAFFVWAALAACAVFWGLRLGATSPIAPIHTVPVGEAALPRADLTRIFGAAPVAQVAEEVAPELSSRFHLLGVVAPRDVGGPGIALIAVDGKTPRAYRVGAVVDGDLTLQSIERRGVAIGARAASATLRLDLPPMAIAATGSLPAAVTDGMPAVAAMPNVPSTPNMPLSVANSGRPGVMNNSAGIQPNGMPPGMAPNGMPQRGMPRLPFNRGLADQNSPNQPSPSTAMPQAGTVVPANER